MRVIAVAVAVLLAGGRGVAASPRSPLACCVTIDLPGITPGEVCRLVRFNVRPRRLAARRLCRAVGGTVPRDGSCACGG